MYRTGRLELTGLVDGDLGSGGAGRRAEGLDLLDNVHTVGDLTEDNVLAVEPGAGDGGHEELGAVGVGAGVGHGQETGSGVLGLKVLVGELGAVDGLASGSVVSGEVSTLQHELGDDSVEDGVGVTKALLAGAQSSEVLGGLGHLVGKQLKVDLADGLAANRDLEKHSGVGHCVCV